MERHHLASGKGGCASQEPSLTIGTVLAVMNKNLKEAENIESHENQY